MSRMKDAQMEIDYYVKQWRDLDSQIKRVLQKIRQHADLLEYAAPCSCGNAPGLLMFGPKLVGCLECQSIFEVDDGWLEEWRGRVDGRDPNITCDCNPVTGSSSCQIH